MAEIYLIRDLSGKPRYVGKANDARERLNRHFMDMRRRNTPLYDWLRTVKPNEVTIEVIETCEGDWRDREKFWIAKFRSEGKMLNLADGGDEPFCPPEVLRANGKANSARMIAARTETPLKKRVYTFCKRVASEWRFASPRTREKVRQNALKYPHLFGCFLKPKFWENRESELAQIEKEDRDSGLTSTH